PLAETLMKDGHYVVVTRRSQTRLKELPTSLTHSALFDFNQLNATARLDELLKQHQITHVIGAFPPGFRKGRGQEYAQQWQILANAAKQNNVEKLLMISSTTVYPNLASDME
ncbi:NAD(P)H-binding protein, partial [Vibrio parahaemolyticus]